MSDGSIIHDCFTRQDGPSMNLILVFSQAVEAVFSR